MISPELSTLTIDDETPADRLRELANLVCQEIHFHENPPNYQTRLCSISVELAQHPNIPTDVLIELFRICPIEVLTHPLLDFFLFEAPDLLDQLYDAYRYIFQKPNLPKFFLEWAKNNSDRNIRLDLVKSSQTPYQYLLYLVNDNDPAIHYWVINSLIQSTQKWAVSDQPALLAMLKRLARDKNFSVRIIIASIQDLSRWMLPESAQNSWQKARNDAILIEILEIMAFDSNSRVRSRVAENPKTPLHILEKLALDKHQNVGVSIASNPNTPAKALAQMAKNKYRNVIVLVAKHQSTPIKTLQVLIQRRDEGIAKLAIDNLQNRT
jgi:hypothetical protein